MSNELTEHKAMDAHDLYRALSRFIDDNQSSNRDELRWLASRAKPLHFLISEWKAGGMETLVLSERESFRDFRLAEINAEQAALDVKRRRLDEEARKLTKPAA